MKNKLNIDDIIVLGTIIFCFLALFSFMCSIHRATEKLNSRLDKLIEVNTPEQINVIPEQIIIEVD